MPETVTYAVALSHGTLAKANVINITANTVTCPFRLTTENPIRAACVLKTNQHF